MSNTIKKIRENGIPGIIFVGLVIFALYMGYKHLADKILRVSLSLLFNDISIKNF